ncbi:eotaxin-like [Scyliorhinus canicula]|uniref:eotaxin-like n=1 Tax=Scyliorhinus canicula TaxID=7830 RepID=UPI0018F4D79C|nr:eotaxin-like [Scyliorhinus canicula]
MKQVPVLICLSIIMYTVSTGPNLIQKSCCRNYSVSVPPLKRIEDYVIQHSDGRCKIEAVVFKLKKILVCSDPDNNEVKNRVEKLLQKRG